MACVKKATVAGFTTTVANHWDIQVDIMRYSQLHLTTSHWKLLRYSDIHLDILRDIVDIPNDISKKSSLASCQPGHSRNQWRISARSSAGEVFGLE